MRFLFSALLFCAGPSSARAFDSVVVFNEVQYHPAAGQAEFVELRNLHGVDINLDGWKITGGVDYAFPAGTILPGHGYLVVGAAPGAIGNFAGTLNNAGETIRLRNRNERIMDELAWEDEGRWPLGADGSGFTLSRRKADASALPEAWTTSLQPGGTPGAQNFVIAPSGEDELTDEGETSARLFFHEISGISDTPFFVEVRNQSAMAVNTDGWTLRAGTGQTVALPATSLAPGSLLLLDQTVLNFVPADGTKLFLLSPGGARLTDTRAATQRLRGLAANGDWGAPTAPTPGAANAFTVNTDVVINEIFYHALQDGPEQWIELHNRSNATVDVSGWELREAVDYTLPPGTVIGPGGYLVIAWDPAAFAQLHPGVTALGPWERNLSGRGERIVLRDASENGIDSVAYSDGGRWSVWADGGGGSLELKDPFADNANPTAWDSSDESTRTPWQNVSYTGTGAHSTTSSVAYFNELVMGLLDAGEILIDDISLREVNAGNRELIQNGDFQSGTTDGWRNIGTHSKSLVVPDPFDPTNQVLKMVSSGGTEHMNNHSETTLKSGNTYVAINTASTYTLSFRAKWLRGTHRLHSRLYFNRLARQTALALPATGGTPGAVNSRRISNLGPTMKPATVSPVVPEAGAPATVQIFAADPQGIGSMELFTRVGGGAFTSSTMTGNAGTYTASVPGQPAGTLLQFYVKATDSLGAVQFWPAAGPDSRAMIPWQDGKTQLVTPAGARPHNFRIVLPGADANFLYRLENVQSNEYQPCTVILDDRRAWYEASTRLKSSEHGRYQQNRVGFNLKFGSDQPFLGAHETISIDRSGNRTTEGLDGSTVTSQREILTKAAMNAAGGIYSTEDDLIRVIPPIATGSPAPAFSGALALGQAILSKSRFDDEYLDGQWENGSDGPMFKQEYIYPLSQTINPVTRAVSNISSSGNLNVTAEYPKISQTGGDPGPGGISVRAYTPPAGTDPKENYRWHWLIRNQRSRDDYSGMIAALTAMSQSGAAFKTQTNANLEVDTWMRAVVPAQLFGITDNYLASSGSTHNFLLYFPPGGKGVAIPWDMDFLGQSSPTAPITSGGDVTRFISDGANKRRYYGHVLDVLNRSFNDAFLTRWANHYSTFGSDNMTTSLSFLRQRATYVRNLVTGQNGQTAPVPVTQFLRTSAAEMSVSTPFATVTGTGWIDIDTIRVQGNPVPLAVTWTSQIAWTLQLPLSTGTHLYTLEGIRPDGSIAGSVGVTVTATGGIAAASAGNLVVSRVHYHPASPTGAEMTSGFNSPDDFEYLELQNISGDTVDLSQCRFETGLTYTFAPGTTIIPRGRLILPRRSQAFALRHPGVTTAPEYFDAADPEGNKLSDGGETIGLLSASGTDIKRFTYDDNLPWPSVADGGGPALILLGAATNPDHANYQNWQASSTPGGSPGTDPLIPFTGTAGADSDRNGRDDLLDFAMGSGASPFQTLTGSSGAYNSTFTFEKVSNANLSATIEVSVDPSASGNAGWQPAANSVLLERTPVNGSLERLTYSVPLPAGPGRAFVRVRFSLP